MTAASAARSRSASSMTTSGPLPPSSSTAALPTAASATFRPVSVEPMKPTPCVPGLRAISSPTVEPGPVTRLKTPAGRSASATHSRERDRGDRGRRRGRPDDGVPAGERGRDQLGRHRVRPVPRSDHPDHAARPADEQHALAGRHRVRQPALQPLPVLGGVPPVEDQLLDLVVRLAQRLALVERQRARELVAAPFDRVARPGASRRRARTRWRAPTPSAAAVRRRDRALCVLAGRPSAPRRSPRRSRATRR